MSRMKKLVPVLLTVLLSLFWISCALSGSAGTLVLPSDLTRIEDMAFMNAEGFRTVTLPDRLESIGSKAFAGSSLMRITIPESVTYIAADAFDGISENAYITVTYGSPAYTLLSAVEDPPYNLVVTGLNEDWSPFIYQASTDAEDRLIVSITGNNNSYYQGDNIIIPETLNGRPIDEIRIEDEAFRYYGAYADAAPVTLYLPACVTYIGDSAFFSAKFTGELSLPSGLRYIGDDAFEFSTFSGSAELPASLEHLGENAFRYCSNLTGNCVIPGSCKKVGKNCFYQCEGLQSLVLENGVEEIGDHAFYCCYGLQGSLTLPESVASIGDFAFSACSFTGSLTILGDIEVIGEGVFSGYQFTGTLTLPGSLREIGLGAFSGNGFTGTLILPYGLRTIGTNAFSGCSGFTGSLRIPDTVTSIGYNSFNGCSGFNGTLTLGVGLRTINGEAFAGTGFTGDLKFPSQLTTLGNGAFANCTGLNGTVTLSPRFSNFDQDYESYYSLGVGTSTLGVFQGCTGITRVVIPDGVTVISPAMFYDCTSLVRVELGSSVERIHAKAFYHCDHLKYINITSSVRAINSQAFRGCTALSGILDLSGIEYLGHPYSPYYLYLSAHSQFMDCPNLAGVILSDTGLKKDTNDSTSMYDSTFSGHGDLFTIYCREDSITAGICRSRGYRYSCVYGTSFGGGLVSKQHAWGEPFELSGYYRNEKTILKLRGTILEQETYETVQQTEQDVNGNVAFYRILNNGLHFEDLPIGAYFLEVEALLEGSEDYIVVAMSGFTVQKTHARAWGADGYALPSGICLQGTAFVPQGTLRMNREIDLAEVKVENRDKTAVYTNQIQPASKVIRMADLLEGFRMDYLLPDTYRITITLTQNNETNIAACSEFRIYPSNGDLTDEQALAIIAFCENIDNAYLFDPYAQDYMDYMNSMGWEDAAVMVICNAKDIAVQWIKNRLFGGSGDGYVKSLYKKALLELMSSFDGDEGIDLDDLDSFKTFFNKIIGNSATAAQYGFDYTKNTFDKTFLDASLDEYCAYIGEHVENLTIGDAFALQDAYEELVEFNKNVKSGFKTFGTMKKVSKYGIDLIDAVSDAIEDHRKGLMAIASLSTAFGEMPDEMRDAMKEIMRDYGRGADSVINVAIDKVEEQITDYAVDELIDLAGETAFTAFLGSTALGYKVTDFVIDRGLELYGFAEKADNNFEFLTLANLVMQSHSAYKDAVYEVRGGYNAEPDPAQANTSTSALNRVYYTFEACKYTMDEMYDLLKEDCLNSNDLYTFDRYSNQQYKLKYDVVMQLN